MLETVSSKNKVQTVCRAHPASSAVGTGGYFPRVKRPGRDVGYCPLSSLEVKNEWIYTSAAAVCLHGVGRDNFIPSLRLYKCDLSFWLGVGEVSKCDIFCRKCQILSLLVVHHTVCFCGVPYVICHITKPEDNIKILVCISPYAMFTRPPVDQYDVQGVNKFFMGE
jgi:hypothetical protein